ncbi:MAG: NACHT domain-containing protein [Caldilinea sp. CFX5]|nr:NACHT domain-containing protein [Caldilinea sp. CFX5]
MMVPVNTFAEFTTLAQFVGDLRSRVFRTKKRAADYFGLHHTTIGRYEDDNPDTHSTPPLGYVAALAQMAVEQLRLDPHQADLISRELLGKLNMAIALCYPGQVRLRTWADVIQSATAYHQPPPHLRAGETFTHPRQEDWGTAPDTDRFFGRMHTLAELTTWVRTARCRVIGIVGMAGVGKTWLAAALVRRVLPDFSHMIWRSLQNAPPLTEILTDCIRLLADQQLMELPTSFDRQLTLLLNLLRAKRCLLIFDNVESILASETPTIRYRPEYESYGLLLRVLSESEHQSCLLLTSREIPPHLVYGQGNLGTVRVWRLNGLDLPAIRQLLATTSISGSEQAWEQLTEHYSGNPLALQLAATVVKEQYAGQIQTFLQDNIAIFGEMRDLLDQQFQRLSRQEQTILYWLAVLREPSTHGRLLAVMLPPLSQIHLIEALQGLLRRCWVEVYAARFGLQNVILDYMTERLVCELSDALLAQSPAHLDRWALLLASSPDYIRVMQRRLLLQPTLQQVITQVGVEEARHCLLRLKADLQQAPSRYTGYAGANLFHLLAQLNESNLQEFDFSHLLLRQAFLRAVELRNITFAHAELIDCEFAEAFGLVDAVAFSPDGRWLATGASNDALYLWEVALEGDPDAEAGATYGLRLLRRFEARPTLGDDDFQMNRQQRIRVLAFHPQGHLLAGGYENGLISIWETGSGRRLVDLTQCNIQVLALAFSPSSAMLLSAWADQTICCWETNHWHCLETWRAGQVRARTIAFSPVSALAAIGVQNTVQVWDRQRHCCQTLLQDEGATEVLSTAFSPDGTLLDDRCLCSDH